MWDWPHLYLYGRSCGLIIEPIELVIWYNLTPCSSTVFISPWALSMCALSSMTAVAVSLSLSFPPVIQLICPRASWQVRWGLDNTWYSLWFTGLVCACLLYWCLWESSQTHQWGRWEVCLSNTEGRMKTNTACSSSFYSLWDICSSGVSFLCPLHSWTTGEEMAKDILQHR